MPAKLIPAIATINLSGYLVSNNQAKGIFLNFMIEKFIMVEILQLPSYQHNSSLILSIPHLALQEPQ